MDKKIFPESSRLKEIIEKHKWTLYQGKPANHRAPDFEELLQFGPATEYQIGKYYLFVPIPKDGQSLREACYVSRRHWPSFIIDDPDSDIWVPLWVQGWSEIKGHPVVFSKLYFNKKGVDASSPITKENPESDWMVVPYSRLIETFEKHFHIAYSKECSTNGPIRPHP